LRTRKLARDKEKRCGSSGGNDKRTRERERKKREREKEREIKSTTETP